MIFDKQGNTTVVTQEAVSIQTFSHRFEEAYPKLKNDNIILNLLSISNVSAKDLLEFSPFNKSHKKAKKSFVIVSGTVNFNEVDDALVVVPTLREAYDIVEMDEIERDLDL